MSAPKNPLWTSAEAEAATLGKASRAFEAGGISIDTRTLKPGDLFVALQGEARDGHEFVGAAFEAGAAAALVSRAPGGLSKNAALLTVAHTQRGHQHLCRAARPRSLVVRQFKTAVRTFLAPREKRAATGVIVPWSPKI